MYTYSSASLFAFFLHCMIQILLKDKIAGIIIDYKHKTVLCNRIR